jgi:hypothetical protein
MAPAQPQPTPSPSDFQAELAGAMAAPPVQQPPVPAPPEVEPRATQGAGAAPAAAPAASSTAALDDAGDLDGARLIALNMALNGESRADTERYLQENFRLADQTTLIDEVYAAIEG